jgi:hypothetical protein
VIDGLLGVFKRTTYSRKWPACRLADDRAAPGDHMGPLLTSAHFRLGATSMHSAGIVAAWILACHRGPLPTSLMGAARARRGIPSRDGKRMDGPRLAQRSTPQFRHSNGVTGSRRARWVSIYRLLTHSPSSTLPRSWGHSRALSSSYEARWHVFGAAAVSGRPGAAGSQSAAGRCWRDGLRGHRCG